MTRHWLALSVAGFAALAMTVASGRGPGPGLADGPLMGRAVDSPDRDTVDATPGEPGSRVRSGGRRYARSAAGAVEAAAAYVVAFDGSGLLDADRRRELIERHAASGSRDDLQRILGEVAGVITARLALGLEDLRDPAFVWRVVPAGWQLRGYSDERAVVAVWATGVVVVDGLPLAERGWRTTEVELLWERDDWRIAGFRSEVGPEPPAVGGTADAAARARSINGFASFRHLSADEIDVDR